MFVRTILGRSFRWSSSGRSRLSNELKTSASSAGTSPVTAYDFGLSATGNAVLGLSGFGTVSVREDDGMPSTPAVGVQGNACTEHAALAHPGSLKVRGGAASGSGFRAGESVAFTLGSKSVGRAIADAKGAVTFQLATSVRQATLKAVGAGSGLVETAAL